VVGILYISFVGNLTQAASGERISKIGEGLMEVLSWVRWHVFETVCRGPWAASSRHSAGSPYTSLYYYKQDAQLSQRYRAAGCVMAYSFWPKVEDWNWELRTL